jgi:flagellum-specific ATP synthase
MNDLTLLERLDAIQLFHAKGRVLRIAGGEIDASGPSASVAAHCEVVNADDERRIVRAQVVSVSSDGLRLVPFGGIEGVQIGDQVRLVDHHGAAQVGHGFAGRAVDALARPIDGGPPIAPRRHRSDPPEILSRVSPRHILPTGVRAIDGLLTLGRGQRIGIFAASGVGKTRLMEQIVRQADCARMIVCQIGERGREVEALWSELQASEPLERISVVAATSDEGAPMRAQALEQALGLAEYWRGQGEDVLLIVDSVTRYAMALREIGLIAGEPPMARAYTPNVLRELPRLVERCGAIRSGGSITALFTVLSEGDDVDDPIVEVMKALLDGHIVLSRRLAEAGHFPAIDIGRSLSRLFDRLADERHAQAAREVRALLAKFEESRILVESGMYKAGSDKDLDRAITARDGMLTFLRQRDTQNENWDAAIDRLINLAERYR